MALGALATAATFVLVLINQKGTQKQIDSLSQMAEMFSRHYQLERIQAGSNIYPKIQISLKDDLMWGLKIQVKNNSYPVEVYRIIIYEPRTHLDIKLKPANNMIEKIMYLYRKYRDEIIFGKLLENLLDMKKPPKKSVVFILRRGRDSNSWCELPRTPV